MLIQFLSLLLDFHLMKKLQTKEKNEAFVKVEVVATLVALVAVVDVVAFPLNAPVKVVVVKLFVLGLKVSPVPKSAA